METETQTDSNMLPNIYVTRLCRKKDLNDLDYVKKWIDLKQQIAPNNQEKSGENVIVGDNGTTKFNFSSALYEHNCDELKFPMIILFPGLKSLIKQPLSNGKTIYIIPYENKKSSQITSVEYQTIATEYITKSMVK